MEDMEQNQTEGTVKKPEASIEKICFSGGNKFSFTPKEKVILVGPNNSGKSQTLRELLDIAVNRETNRPVVVKKVDFKKEGSADQLRQFLDEHADFKNGFYTCKNWQLHQNRVEFWNDPSLQRGLAPGFIKNIGADERLQICFPPDRIDPGEQMSRPQHVLNEDSPLMEKVSDLFRLAFGKSLMFDLKAKTLRMHVGAKPSDDLVDQDHPNIPTILDDYCDIVRKNPLLHTQGDGMKSYAGILFETIVSDLDINLLDEPEAFLHPPQMRHIGKTLASEVSGQLFAATHSSDIMRGFLEGSKGNVRLLRINRQGDQNFVKEAKPEIVQELWKDPVLRYSNALEGVFHEETIICEAGSDCRLLNAVADHLSENDSQSLKDTAYVPAGGKHNIRKIANVLRQVDVPVKAVFDIDFLAEENLVKETVEAFGGNTANIMSLWKKVDAAVRDGVKPKKPEEIRSELLDKINGCRDDVLPSKSDLEEIMKQKSSWNMVKKYGKTKIPRGNAQTDFKELKKKLKSIGIYVIDKGEIENFCMEIGSHGTKFVTRLLTDIPLEDSRLQDLRKFVKHVHKGPHAPLLN